MRNKNIIGCGLIIFFCLGSFIMQAQKSFAETLADQQLEAYNNKDLDGFLKPFADNVRIYDDLDKYNVTTKQEMRKNYDMWFNSVEDLHCEIITRIADGNIVVDYEKVTYRKAGQEEKTLKAIAIYRIEGNKISEVSFIRP